MSLYPPPPPGWDSHGLPLTPGDEASAGKALDAWATARKFELTAAPSLEWYQSWAPFVYLFTPTRLGREVSGKVGDAAVWIVEAWEDAARADDEHKFVLSFVTSPKLSYRAAIRSRLPQEQVEELRTTVNLKKTPRSLGRWRFRERDQLLRRTYGQRVRGVLGDAIFEAHCEIATPSREEGVAALPIALRHLIVQGGWRGILEFRPGGMVMSTYSPPLFDPASLDATLALIHQFFGAATKAQYPAPPPSSGPVSSGGAPPAPSSPVSSGR